jgi:prepilin-type processing-associated H-X9-DG protein
MNVSMVRPRLAFSLAEQLIVVAILAVLLGLVLPAVQRARETAVRSRCQDNLRRIGEALHTYHDNHGQLPAGASRYHPDLGLNVPPNGYHAWWSWMAELLPELGHDEMYRTADSWARQNPTPTSPRNWWPWGSLIDGTPANPVLGQVLSLVVCPADPREAILPTAQARLLPIEVNGPVSFTGYLGVSGTHGGHGGDGQPAATFDGVLYFDSRVRFADLKTGLANVAAVGERPPNLELRFGWWFAGGGYDADPVLARRKYGGTGDVVLGSHETGFARAIDANCGTNQVGLRPGSVLDPCAQSHFWSFHPGGAHFLFCDGSVRFLTPEANLPALSTRTGSTAAAH